MSRRDAHPLDGLPVSVFDEIARRLDPATLRRVRLVSRGCTALSSKGLGSPRRVQLALSAGAQGVRVVPAAPRGVRDRFPLATTLVLTGHATGAGGPAAAAAAAAELRAMAAEGAAWRGVERFEADEDAAAEGGADVCAALLGLLPDLKGATLAGRPEVVLPAAARCGALEDVTLLLDAAPPAGGEGEDGEGAGGAGPSVEELAALLGGLAGLKRCGFAEGRRGAPRLDVESTMTRGSRPRAVHSAAGAAQLTSAPPRPRAACASPTPTRRCAMPCC
jgi:hypothetical protein